MDATNFAHKNQQAQGRTSWDRRRLSPLAWAFTAAVVIAGCLDGNPKDGDQLAFNAAAADSEVDAHYVGVFVRPALDDSETADVSNWDPGLGCGGNPTTPGCDWTTFLSEWQEREGRHLIDVEAFTLAGERRFAGVYEPGATDDELVRAETWNELEQMWGDRQGESYLSDVEVFLEAGERRYLGVFRSGNRPQSLHDAALESDLSDLGITPPGYHIVDFEVYSWLTGTRYVAIVESGERNTLMDAGDLSAFHDLYHELGGTLSEGGEETLLAAPSDFQLLSDVEPCSDNAGSFAGLWHRFDHPRLSHEEDWLWIGHHFKGSAHATPAFIDKWEELSSSQLRLVDFEVLGEDAIGCTGQQLRMTTTDLGFHGVRPVQVRSDPGGAGFEITTNNTVPDHLPLVHDQGSSGPP